MDHWLVPYLQRMEIFVHRKQHPMKYTYAWFQGLTLSTLFACVDILERYIFEPFHQICPDSWSDYEHNTMTQRYEYAHMWVVL